MKLKIQIVGGDLIDCQEIFHYEVCYGGKEITEDEFVKLLENGGTFHCCSALNGGAALAINTDKVVCFVDGVLYVSK